jgi:hypothetical protein
MRRRLSGYQTTAQDTTLIYTTWLDRKRILAALGEDGAA